MYTVRLGACGRVRVLCCARRVRDLNKNNVSAWWSSGGHVARQKTTATTERERPRQSI